MTLLAALIAVALGQTACSSSPSVSAGATQSAVEAVRLAPPAVVMEVAVSVLITESDEPAGDLARVVVSPEVVVADAGETVRLAAQAFLEGGEPDPGVDLVWALTDIRAGSIRPNGEFTAGAVPGVYPGAISVTALKDTGRGIIHATEVISVTVVGEGRPARMASIEILPSDPMVFSGQLLRMRAVAYDDNGFVIPGASFDWAVNDPDLGTVTAVGYLNVEAPPGTFAMGVSATGRWQGERLTKTVDVTVLAARPGVDDMTVQVLPQRFHIDRGDNMQLRAVALNGLGELVTGTQLRWSIDEKRAGTITGTGMFTAGATPGIYTEAVKVEAIIPGESGVIHAADYASVIVRGERSARRLDGVVARPGSVIVSPGGRTLLVARGLDAEGQSADQVELRWEMADDAAGVIDENGSFRASSQPGAYPKAARVIATQDVGGEQITRSATVDVSISGTLSEAAVEPVLGMVQQGRAVHFSAIGRDENGLLLPGLVVRWRLADDKLGAIDALGNFTAGDSPGLYEDAIIATVTQLLTD